MVAEMKNWFLVSDCCLQILYKRELLAFGQGLPDAPWDVSEKILYSASSTLLGLWFW